MVSQPAGSKPVLKEPMSPLSRQRQWSSYGLKGQDCVSGGTVGVRRTLIQLCGLKCAPGSWCIAIALPPAGAEVLLSFCWLLWLFNELIPLLCLCILDAKWKTITDQINRAVEVYKPCVKENCSCHQR